MQSRLVPAQYYRDPEDVEGYLENSNFLADINNEREIGNATYKENLKKLKKFVMFIFSDDETVVPKESAWFADYNKTSEEVTWLKDRKIYNEDWLGLKWLNEKHRLEFRVAKGKHMQLSEDLLSDAFKQYFGDTTSGKGVE